MDKQSWLRSVGKVIVFDLEGSEDDEGVSVYPQSIATTITSVTFANDYPRLRITPVKPRGDDVVELINEIEVHGSRVVVGLDVEGIDGSLVGISVRGNFIEVY